MINKLKIYLKNDTITNLLLSFLFTFFVHLTMPVSERIALGLSDGSIFEYFGYAMSKGEQMYINMFDHKGPFIFIINYIGYKIHGELGIRILYLLSIFIFFYICTLITKLLSKKKITPFVLTLSFISLEYFFQLGWNVEGYALPAITYSFYIYLKYFIKNEVKSYEIILTGLSFAYVFFIRANMIGTWILFSLFVFISLLYRKDFNKLVQFISYFLIGILIIILPLFLYLYTHGILNEMFYDSLYINFLYSQGDGVGKRKILNWIIDQFNTLQLLLIFSLSSIIAFKKYKWRVILYLFTFGFCSILAIMSKRTYMHYLIVLIPYFIPFFAIIFDKLYSKLRLKYLSIFIALTMIYYSPLIQIKNNIIYRTYNYYQNEYKVAAYIKEHTNENDRIYSHRMQGLIYLESDRLSNTKYFFIPALEDETPIINDFKSHFEKQFPKYIIFNPNYDYARLTDTYIKNIIKSKYKLVYKVENVYVYNLRSIN